MTERHFALAENVAYHCQTNPGSLVSVSGQKSRSDPCISSIATAIMITTSNSSFKRSGMPQSISRCSLAHHGDFRAVPRVSLGLRPAKSHENYFESKRENEG